MTRRNLARAMLLLLLLLALIAAGMMLPLTLGLIQARAWIEDFGPWGPALFVLLYVLAVVLLVPGSVLALSAGLAYGAWGVPLALTAATTGATLSFLIGRYIARDQVHLLARRRPVLRAVETAVSEGGWRIVGLVRLSPFLPFSLLNYFFGVTRIPFRHYVMATFFGIVPGTSVNVFVAAAGHAASLDGLRNPLRLALFGIGLIVTAVVCRYLLRRIRIAIKHAELQLHKG